MIRNLLIILILFVSLKSFSQQQPLYNQYYVNPYVYNPSFAGFSNGMNVSLLRNQKWADFDGGAVTNFLSASTLLKDKKSGVGLNLFSDYVGVTSKLGVNATYAYRVDITDDFQARFGLSAGLLDNRVLYGKLIVSETGDPLLGTTGERKTAFDANFGFNLHYHDFLFGLAIPHLLGNKLDYTDNNSFSYQLERQFISNVGYSFYVDGAEHMRLMPQALVMYTPNAPFRYDLSLIFDYDKFGWAAVTYKSSYALGLNIGANVGTSLKIGVAYDLMIADVKNYATSPNMEVLVNYAIPFKKKQDLRGRVDLDDLPDYDAQLDDQQALIDSLNEVLAEGQHHYEEEIEKLEKAYQDTINSLRQDLAEANEAIAGLKELNEKLQKQSNSSNNGSNNQENKPSSEDLDGVIKYSEDDHFLELDKSESEKGYYVITGAFGKVQYAERMLANVKEDFPNARIIFNERNQLNYVLLNYSLDKYVVFNDSKKALGLGYKKAWILQYK